MCLFMLSSPSIIGEFIVYKYGIKMVYLYRSISAVTSTCISIGIGIGISTIISISTGM